MKLYQLLAELLLDGAVIKLFIKFLELLDAAAKHVLFVSLIHVQSIFKHK